jgi:crotonobetainyl-CoA hydratase
MSYEFVKVEKKDHITKVTLNRPERMNAIHPPASRELGEIFEEFADDPDQWVAIITGAGDRAFSAGNDLKFQAENGRAKMTELSKGIKGGFAGVTARMDCFKPMIAAVNGFAMGGGFEIALACDIILASENATFALPEPRVGLMAAAGGVHRLPRRIPYHLAMGMILTGKRLTAAEAQSYGIVNEVVAPDELQAAAERWAGEILECSPLSVRASKEAVFKGLGLPIEHAYHLVVPGQAAMIQSEDFIEGPKAFAEKRKPNWKGR